MSIDTVRSIYGSRCEGSTLWRAPKLNAKGVPIAYGTTNTNNLSNTIRVPTATVTPSNITGSGWLEIKGGANGICGRRDDSTAYCWGIPTSLQLGDPNWGQYFTPVGG